MSFNFNNNFLNWILDNGAGVHIAFARQNFIQGTLHKSNNYVYTASGENYSYLHSAQYYSILRQQLEFLSKLNSKKLLLSLHNYGETTFITPIFLKEMDNLN